MCRQSTMHTSPTLPEPDRSHGQTVWNAVGFWLTAFCATAIVAALVLAPRLKHIRQLERTVSTLTSRCLELDRQNEKLARLLRALRHDPELQRQLAQWELEGRPEDRVPAVLTDLEPLPVPQAPRTDPLVDRLIQLFATDRVVAQAGFATAAALYIVSLVCYRSPTPSGSPSETRDRSPAPADRPPLRALTDERTLSDDECLF